MPDLRQVFEGHDLGFLRIVASNWGIELTAPDAATGAPILIKAMSNRELALEVLETFPEEARDALAELLAHEGRLSWTIFTRKFGEVRVVGAGRRDRMRPDLNPISPAEFLWYRGWIARAFLHVENEPQEYAYLPDELAEMIGHGSLSQAITLGRPATPGEILYPRPCSDQILDSACTVLAALRLEFDLEHLSGSGEAFPTNFMLALLESAGLVDSSQKPVPAAVQDFLESTRSEALKKLTTAWMDSRSCNDLRLLPGLRFEGQWENDPLLTRKTILDFLSQIPQDTWWNLTSFIQAIHDRHPNYQRPAGDYDSWFIRQEDSEIYLRGFSSWDLVDGALLRFLVCGPLHWLGFYDLAAATQGGEPVAFKPSRWSQDLWHGRAPAGLAIERERARITSDGRMILTAQTPRWVRYQLARFAAWEKDSVNEYFYRITPASLERARQQGLRSEHLLRIITKFGAPPIPPSFQASLERWEKFGSQASIAPVTLLQVAHADILDNLRKTRASRFLGAALNATTVIIKNGGEETVRNALMELGYLAEFRIDVTATGEKGH